MFLSIFFWGCNFTKFQHKKNDFDLWLKLPKFVKFCLLYSGHYIHKLTSELVGTIFHLTCICIDMCMHSCALHQCCVVWSISSPIWSFIAVEGTLCHNPTLGKVGECNSHSQKWRLGVVRDSRKLRRRFEGSNLLALMRSLYQWKALEA